MSSTSRGRHLVYAAVAVASLWGVAACGAPTGAHVAAAESGARVAAAVSDAQAGNAQLKSAAQALADDMQATERAAIRDGKMTAGVDYVNSSVTVHALTLNSENTSELQATVELLYDRDIQGEGEIIESAEVIPHVITVDKRSGKIVAQEKHDMQWMVDNHVSDQDPNHVAPGAGSEDSQPAKLGSP